jgi:hypothetical protein
MIPKHFPIDSQVVPNPLFNTFGVKRTRFYRGFHELRTKSFFRGLRARARHSTTPPIAEPPNKPMAKRRIPGFVLGATWVRPVFVLPSSCLQNTRKNTRKTANSNVSEEFAARRRNMHRRPPASMAAGEAVHRKYEELRHE